MKMIASTARTQKFGLFLSILCVIHCAITPIVLTLAPLAGSQIFHSHFLEFGLIALSLAIAFYGIVRNSRQNLPIQLALILVTGGTLAIIANFLFLPEAAEVYAMSAGGLMIASGQVINVRQGHKAAGCEIHDH